MAKSLRALHWKESLHPRDNRGRFAEKGGSRWLTRVSDQLGARMGDVSMGAAPGKAPQGRLKTGKGGLIDVAALSKAAPRSQTSLVPRSVFAHGPESAPRPAPARDAAERQARPLVGALKKGDHARVKGEDIYGRPITMTGYVDNPQPVRVGKGRNKRDMISVSVSEQPDGGGTRSRVLVAPDATAERTTPSAEMKRLEGVKAPDVLAKRLSDEIGAKLDQPAAGGDEELDLNYAGLTDTQIRTLNGLQADPERHAEVLARFRRNNAAASQRKPEPTDSFLERMGAKVAQARATPGAKTTSARTDTGPNVHTIARQAGIERPHDDGAKAALDKANNRLGRGDSPADVAEFLRDQARSLDDAREEVPEGDDQRHSELIQSATSLRKTADALDTPRVKSETGAMEEPQAPKRVGRTPGGKVATPKKTPAEQLKEAVAAAGWKLRPGRLPGEVVAEGTVERITPDAIRMAVRHRDDSGVLHRPAYDSDTYADLNQISFQTDENGKLTAAFLRTGTPWLGARDQKLSIKKALEHIAAHPRTSESEVPKGTRVGADTPALRTLDALTDEIEANPSVNVNLDNQEGNTLALNVQAIRRKLRGKEITEQQAAQQLGALLIGLPSSARGGDIERRIGEYRDQLRYGSGDGVAAGKAFGAPEAPKAAPATASAAPTLPVTQRAMLAKIDAHELTKSEGLHPAYVPVPVRQKLLAAGLIEGREVSTPLGKRDKLHLTPAGHEALKAAEGGKYEQRRADVAAKAAKASAKEAAQRERAATMQAQRDAKLARDLETARREGLNEQEVSIGGLDFARQQRDKRATEAEAAQAAAIAFGVPAYEKGQGGYSGPNYQAALATNSKLIKKLQKDHTDDEIKTIAPQYRAYLDTMTALDKARADVASAQRRSEYINTIRLTGDDESYRPSLDASNADVRAAFAAEQDAHRAAQAAHGALEDAAVGLYTAKGRTKKASTLAIPAPERTGPVSDRPTLKERISEALPATEGAATAEVKAARQAVLARLRTEDQIANEEATAKRHDSRAGVIMRYEGGDSPYPSPERKAKREEAAAQRALAGEARGRVRALEGQLRARQEEERRALARMEASKPQVVAGVSYADVVAAVDAASTGGRSHRTEEAVWRADIRQRLNLPDPGDEPMRGSESIEVSRDDIRVGDFIGGERGGLGFQVASVTRNHDGSILLSGLGMTGADARTLKPGEADTVKVWRPGVSDRNRAPLRPEEDDLPLMAQRMLQGMDEDDRYAAAERLRASKGLPSRPRATPVAPSAGDAFAAEARAAVADVDPRKGWNLATEAPAGAKIPLTSGGKPKVVRPGAPSASTKALLRQLRRKNGGDPEIVRESLAQITKQEFDALPEGDQKLITDEISLWVRTGAPREIRNARARLRGEPEEAAPGLSAGSMSPILALNVGMAPDSKLARSVRAQQARAERAAGVRGPAIDRAVADLAQAQSRERAHTILSGMTQAELADVAQRLDVNISGRNKADALERIVEATVGARLNSAAIRDPGNFQGASYLGPRAGRTPAGPTFGLTVEQARERLADIDSREGATALLSGLNREQLRELAGSRGTSSLSKQQLVARAVDLLVGGRLQHEAIMEGRAGGRTPSGRTTAAQVAARTEMGLSIDRANAGIPPVAGLTGRLGTMAAQLKAGKFTPDQAREQLRTIGNREDMQAIARALDIEFTPYTTAGMLEAAIVRKVSTGPDLARVRAVVELGTSFSGNPYFKLPKLEALTDADWAALTPDQQDNARFLISKLAKGAPGEATRRAQALEARFGAWNSRGKA